MVRIHRANLSVWSGIGYNALKDGPVMADWYDTLTPKEREVLEAYAKLHAYQAVANHLGKSVNVVDQQLASVRRKLGVNSMAEAMYLLAERKAGLATSAKVEPAPEPFSREPPRVRPRVWPYLAVLACALLVAVFVWAAQPGHSNPSGTADAEELSHEIIALRTSGLPKDDLAARQSQLVRALCARAWADMWGPREDYTRDRMADVAPEIRQAFDWSLRNDPDTALAIIGDGHRIFSRLDAFHDWPTMLDRALANPGTDRGLEYGRALCGVAFAHWQDDPDRGYAAAQSALQVFRSLPDSEWEQANAIRHMGLCSRTYRERISLYHQALAIFERLHDSRGQAHVLLGFAQSGWYTDSGGPTRAAQRIDFALRASELFRKLHNASMLREALAEVERDERLATLPAQFNPLRVRVRNVYVAMAAESLGERQIAQQLSYLVRCVTLDVELRDRKLLRMDLETMLRNPTGRPPNPEAAAKLLGAYSVLPKNGASTWTPPIPASAKEIAWFQIGRTMPPSDIVRMAAQYDVVP